MAAVALAALAVGAALTGCTRAASSSSTYIAPTCTQLLDAAINYERTGTGDINAILQSLSERCTNEYEVATDYISHTIEGDFRIDSCEELLGYGVRPEAVELLRQDRWCSFGIEATTVTPDWPEGGLGWDEARQHSGTVQRVCGPLMSARETADGTFINVGRDYPSADRFTFIFWDMYLERIPSDAIICGRGEIYLYNGVAQMEMQNPAALEIWR
ncbi:hypothetical protein [Microbacterium sp. NIBRBAC000506063]|uniref:hypothetical protein n=1 Tax=Microbacterium sp. NIBRBAC000506063 TaxID=2734618 RepID=UPI001BB7E5D0|nr:hypothetical protein [Microbacterium sp. NIBRBAC000506063]QTV80772.1 hypothetical protein KAE78_15075 [Microbacterium sp. NIBRBAC000506063]